MGNDVVEVLPRDTIAKWLVGETVEAPQLVAELRAALEYFGGAAEQQAVTLPSPEEATRTLTRHPRWQASWHVIPEALAMPNAWSVVATDASGAEFGFGVSAGWPEMARTMALALCRLLGDLDAD